MCKAHAQSAQKCPRTLLTASKKCLTHSSKHSNVSSTILQAETSYTTLTELAAATPSKPVDRRGREQQVQLHPEFSGYMLYHSIRSLNKPADAAFLPFLCKCTNLGHSRAGEAGFRKGQRNWAGNCNLKGQTAADCETLPPTYCQHGLLALEETELMWPSDSVL